MDHAHGPGHGHRHDHGHPHADDLLKSRRLGAAFALSLAVLALEAAGGYLARSLALWSDALHMLTDAASLGLAWLAARQALRRPGGRYTYGFYRSGVLAALFNAATLLLVSAVILVEAVRRLVAPAEPVGPLMTLVAASAGGANVLIARALGHGHGDLNVRGAWLHVVGDAAASAAVAAGGLVVWLFGVRVVDPVLSLGIAGLVLWGTVRLGREALAILMEAAPFWAPIEAVAEALLRRPEVLGVHDLHVWSLDGARAALTCHVVVRPEDLPRAAEVADGLAAMLGREFGIVHTTLQVEGEGHGHCEELACRTLAREA
ncbi:MAG: cation transporter [Clostridia bacterium]|nr:cation transporter [Clostridia bacterium]